MYRFATILLAAAVVSPAYGAVNLVSNSPSVDVEIVYEGTGTLQQGSLAIDQSEMGLSEITPGTRFESYLILISDFDSCSLHPYEATFDFDAPVLGIQTDVNSLRPGRRVLDESGFNAAAPAGGLSAADDTVTLNGDLVVQGRVGGPRGVDPIRVFVEATAVPEFASAGIWGAFSIAGVLMGGRRRR